MVTCFFFYLETKYLRGSCFFLYQESRKSGGEDLARCVSLKRGGVGVCRTEEGRKKTKANVTHSDEYEG